MRTRLFRRDDARGPLERAGRLALQTASWALLPARVRSFWLRALVQAWRAGDEWAIAVACRPAELHRLLRAAGDAALVVEIGTGAAWTTAALALAAPGRTVETWDVVRHAQVDRTLALLDAATRARIAFTLRDGSRPEPSRAGGVGALFLDSSHQRDETIATFAAWAPALEPGAPVVFHDWDDPSYPGVTEAIRALGLRGTARGHLFLWRRPAP